MHVHSAINNTVHANLVDLSIVEDLSLLYKEEN